MNRAGLKRIAAEVLKGRPEAACALPPNEMVRVHILVAEGVRAAGSFRNIYKYFSALPRFQCALMWMILLKHTRPMFKQMCAWYRGHQALTEVICNSLFCSQELHNGQWVPDNKPVLYEAKCSSLDKILSYV